MIDLTHPDPVIDWNTQMNAEELANRFRKISAAVIKKDKQTVIAAENKEMRTADIEHCKQAMEHEVIPFLEELKHHLGPDQFSASQIGLNDRAADVDRRRFGGHPRAARREQTA